MSDRGSAHKGVDAFVAYLEAIFARYPARAEQMIAAVRTRSRNNVAAELDDVYPGNPELARKAHRRLANGLYVGTNLSNPDKVQIARQVALAAGLTFGTDAILELVA